MLALALSTHRGLTGPRRASGGTFHRSQLSAGELHLLSGTGRARRHRLANAAAHNCCLKDDYVVYSCPQAQQMTVSRSRLPPPRLPVKASHQRETDKADQHSAEPPGRMVETTRSY